MQIWPDGRVLARIIQCAVNRRGVSHRCKSCLGSCRDTPVATEAVARVTDRLKPSGQRPTVGGAASRWAAIGVTLAQVSNVPSRGPTGLHNREGRWSPCEQPTDDHRLARRGKGRGTSTPHTGQHGRSQAARRSAGADPAAGSSSMGLTLNEPKTRACNGRRSRSRSWGIPSAQWSIAKTAMVLGAVPAKRAVRTGMKGRIDKMLWPGESRNALGALVRS